MLLSNKITRFFVHQYIWKEAVTVLHFLHRDRNKGNKSCETIVARLTAGEFGWSGGDMVYLEVIQNGRLIEFEGN